MFRQGCISDAIRQGGEVLLVVRLCRLAYFQDRKKLYSSLSIYLSNLAVLVLASPPYCLVPSQPMRAASMGARRVSSPFLTLTCVLKIKSLVPYISSLHDCVPNSTVLKRGPAHHRKLAGVAQTHHHHNRLA